MGKKLSYPHKFVNSICHIRGHLNLSNFQSMSLFISVSLNSSKLETAYLNEHWFLQCCIYLFCWPWDMKLKSDLKVCILHWVIMISHACVCIWASPCGVWYEMAIKWISYNWMRNYVQRIFCFYAPHFLNYLNKMVLKLHQALLLTVHSNPFSKTYMLLSRVLFSKWV